MFVNHMRAIMPSFSFSLHAMPCRRAARSSLHIHIPLPCTKIKFDDIIIITTYTIQYTHCQPPRLLHHDHTQAEKAYSRLLQARLLSSARLGQRGFPSVGRRHRIIR